MTMKQRGLGRGLGALLTDYSENDAAQAVTTLPLQRIEPNPNQPRKRFDEVELQALADSIAQHGLLQPLAGLSEVPVTVVEADDRTVMELALVENLQREDLNPMEEAEGYRVLLEEYGLTQEQAAQQVGKSRSAVANALRLLTLSDEVRALVENGELTAGHARALLTLPNGRLQKAAAQKILALRLSVRQAEAMCKRMAAEEKPKEEPEPLAVDYIAECEKHLTRRLGRRVHIVNGKRKGRVELDFYGDDDLQKLYEALCALKRTEDTHGG